MINFHCLQELVKELILKRFGNDNQSTGLEMSFLGTTFPTSTNIGFSLSDAEEKDNYRVMQLASQSLFYSGDFLGFYSHLKPPKDPNGSRS